MLKSLPEGETDKSYGKTINFRVLKIFFELLFRITYTFCMHTKKRLADMNVKSFEFAAAGRGFHVYQDIWLPYINETVKCLHELGNTYYVFAIKCIKGNMIVGHLPKEISRPTKYPLDWGAIVTATITSENCEKSPLFQGGLEIRWVTTVTMIATVRGRLLLQRYEQFVKILYAEPKDKVIVGSYLKKTNLSAVQANERVRAKKKKKNPKDDVKSKGICDMLKK